MPRGVRVVDFGFHGSELALTLLDDATEAAKSDDAVPRGGQPGTLRVDVSVVQLTRYT